MEMPEYFGLVKHYLIQARKPIFIVKKVLCWLLLFVVMLHGWMEQGVNAVFMLFPATATAVSTHQLLTPLCLPSLLLPIMHSFATWKTH